MLVYQRVCKWKLLSSSIGCKSTKTGIRWNQNEWIGNSKESEWTWNCKKLARLAKGYKTCPVPSDFPSLIDRHFHALKSRSPMARDTASATGSCQDRRHRHSPATAGVTARGKHDRGPLLARKAHAQCLLASNLSHLLLTLTNGFNPHRWLYIDG